MKIIKLGLLIIAIVILTGCGEKCVRSHEEESTCAGYIWTGKSMIPYNDMKKLEFGSYACVFRVYSSGDLGSGFVNGTRGVRPVFTLKTE